MTLAQKLKKQIQLKLIAITLILVIGTGIGIGLIVSEVRDNAKHSVELQIEQIQKMLLTNDQLYLDQTTTAMKILKKTALSKGEPRVSGSSKAGNEIVPQLFVGEKKLPGKFEIVDEIKSLTSATATLFVKSGADFVRVSTNVQKPDGTRAIGTKLDPKGKAIAAIKDDKAFYGVVDILGSPYMTGYEPMKNRKGELIGIWYVGYPLSAMKNLGDLIENSHILKSGFSVLYDAKGKVLFHSKHISPDHINQYRDSKNLKWRWKLDEFEFKKWGFKVVTGYDQLDIWLTYSVLFLLINTLIMAGALFVISNSSKNSWQIIEAINTAISKLIPNTAKLKVLSGTLEDTKGAHQPHDRQDNPLLSSLDQSIREVQEATANMELMVLKLDVQSKSIRRLLDNAGQGFLSIDSQGIIGNEYSKAVVTLFGLDPAGKSLAELYGQEKGSWDEYVRLLFEEALPFADLVPICPSSVIVNEKFIELSYKPVRNNDGKLTHVMILATDATSLRELQRKSVKEQQVNRAIIKILGSKNDMIEIIDTLDNLVSQNQNQTDARRALHTLKGSFSFLSCQDLAALCHHWEDALKTNFGPERFKEAVVDIKSKLNTFVETHDKILNIKGSSKKVIPIAVDAIHDIISEAQGLRTPHQVIQSLENLIERPAEEVLGWIGEAFLVSAENMGKTVAPMVWETSDRITPEPYTELFRSLIHIPRNSADHGIEAPDDREMLGKPKLGHLTAKLELAKDYYWLSFKDDGAGVDLDRIRAKAQQLGLPVPQDDAGALDLLFEDGLTTKEEVSETSGRGVGLNAIRAAARKLGGDITAVNSPGQGLEFKIWFKKIKSNRSFIKAA